MFAWFLKNSRSNHHPNNPGSEFILWINISNCSLNSECSRLFGEIVINLPHKFSSYFERKLRLRFKVSKLAERLHAAPNGYYFCIAKTYLLISFPALSKTVNLFEPSASSQSETIDWTLLISGLARFRCDWQQRIISSNSILPAIKIINCKRI